MWADVFGCHRKLEVGHRALKPADLEGQAHEAEAEAGAALRQRRVC
jgi:hypothetical protein